MSTGTISVVKNKSIYNAALFTYHMELEILARVWSFPVRNLFCQVCHPFKQPALCQLFVVFQEILPF